MKATVNGKSLKGTVCAIASKSAAHRYLICAALSEGVTYVRCENRSDDISATARCLRSMGAKLSYSDGGYYVGGIEKCRNASLDCGESGSTLRFLLPVCASLGETADFIRGERLRVRPLKPLIDEMCRHGCCSTKIDDNPLRVWGHLCGGYYEIPGDISSQFVSGLLFALPLCRDDSRIKITGKTVSHPYIDLTVSILSEFGIIVSETEDGYYIPGGQKYISPQNITVEGDWSNGAFWLCAAYMGQGITVTGLDENSIQGDRMIIKELEKLKQKGKVYIDASDIPDLVPVLSVAAAVREGVTVIYNASFLREKESDRLKNVAEMIKSLGGNCKETSDGLKITGVKELHGATVSACKDHRIAMACALASCAAGEVTITGAEAVSKSYPSFWEDFKKANGTVILQ